MRRLRQWLLAILVLVSCSHAQKPLCRERYPSRSDEWHDCRIQIGGLAIQGAAAFERSLGPTFQGYLTSIFNGSDGLEFEALPLNFNQNFEYVSGKKLDYIYSNPAAYTCMMVEFNIATTASLMNFRKGNALDQFAGVIFSRVESNFSTVDDLRQAHVAAVSITGLGAMQLQQAELLKKGLNIMTDVKRLTFTSNQNKIVQDVQNGYADVGFVRTDMIDRSVDANQTKWEYFKVIHQINDTVFPFARSTAFTPEWPIGALAHVPPTVTEKVGYALMQLDRFSADPVLSEPPISGNFATWVPPMNYLELLDMLKDINYYDPDTRKCLRADDVLQAVNCPSGWVRQKAENAFCAPELCKEGYQCLCQPCVKLKDPELVFMVSTVPTSWNPNENETAIMERTIVASHCGRMSRCASAALGQRLHWELLDQIGEANRLQINQYRIESVEMLTEYEGEWQALERHNVTIDGVATEKYTLDTFVGTQGTAVVQLRINGVQAAMTPTILEGFETVKQRVFCPSGHRVESNGTCSACPMGYRGETVVSDQTGLLTDTCLPCEVGYFQNQAGQSLCKTCGIGTISSSPGRTACTRCPDGSSTLNEDRSSECTPCKPGQEAALTSEGEPGCRDCPVGYAAAEEGSLECLPCNAGTFASVEGSLRCMPCSPGYFANQSGLAQCEPCERGFYTGAAEFSECQACDRGMTTLDKGTFRQEDCQCPEGWYLDPNAACVSCNNLDGLTCPGGNGPPLQAAGFWVDVLDADNREYSVYACRSSLECPAGQLGHCAGGRDGKACNDCLDGFRGSSNGECKECQGTDLIPSLLAFVLLVSFIFGLVLMVNADRCQQSLSRLTVFVVCGQVVMAVQALSAIRQLSISWIEPVRTVLNVIKLATLDLDILQISCFFRRDSPHIKFALQLLSYPIFVFMLLVVWGILTLKGWKISVDTLFNINGIILFMLFITFTLTVWLPFQCAPNPNGTMSMAVNPGITCWDTSEHWVLVLMGILGTLGYPVAIIAWATWTVLQYPTRIQSGEGLRLIHRHRFFFERFQVHRYYFGLVLLLRNTAVALIPVVFVAVASMQIIAMGVVLLFGLALQSSLWPWRTQGANQSDLGSACFLIMVLLGSAPLVQVDASTNEEMLGVLLLVCVLGSVACGFAIMCHGIYRRFKPRKEYDAFLCHHKQGAGSLCRWIKLTVQKHSECRIFLDSDDLADLDTLFDSVRCLVKNLVVVLTPEVLKRIWCAGEIVTAHSNEVPIVVLETDGFAALSVQDIEHVGDSWTDEEKHLIASYGITEDMICDAYRHLMELPMLRLVRVAPVPEQERTVIDLINTCKIPRRTFANVSEGTGTPKILVLGNLVDLEALATCQVLQTLMQRTLQEEVEVIRTMKQVGNGFPAVTYLVIVLTRGMLLNPDFMSCYATLVEVLGTNDPPVELVPVNADVGFEFPNVAFYQRLESKTLINDTGNDYTRFLMEAYKMLFSNLALPLTPHASESLVKQQVNEVCQRFRKLKRTTAQPPAASINEAVMRRLSSQTSSMQHTFTGPCHPSDSLQAKSAGSDSSCMEVFQEATCEDSATVVQAVEAPECDEKPQPQARDYELHQSL